MLKLYRNFRMVFIFFPKSEPMVEGNSGIGSLERSGVLAEELLFIVFPVLPAGRLSPRSMIFP